MTKSPKYNLFIEKYDNLTVWQAYSTICDNSTLTLHSFQTPEKPTSHNKAYVIWSSFNTKQIEKMSIQIIWQTQLYSNYLYK
jgi:hypothetical protein